MASNQDEGAEWNLEAWERLSCLLSIFLKTNGHLILNKLSPPKWVLLFQFEIVWGKFVIL